MPRVSKKAEKMVVKNKNAAHKDAPVIRVKHHSYQPSRAELREPIVLPPGTTPEDLARAAVRVARVEEQD